MEQHPSEAHSPPASIQDLEAAIERQSQMLAGLAAEAERNHSTIAALIALGQALVESHPTPSAVAKSFLDQIDLVGSVVSSEQAERYRDDIQKINMFILDVVNRRSHP
ncbi:hypothetical protein [Acidovorax sp. Root219]|jgi:hypothetical protein|uniref:hypothetical protein n=1 Tax=Acidovorax sp. Root219 TaxID=1736493 RepID=UPI0012F74247|nr:hypothetical protein [Acidovorax sp. Root219]